MAVSAGFTNFADNSRFCGRSGACPAPGAPDRRLRAGRTSRPGNADTLEETRKQTPSLARKAIRAEIDGLMDDVAVPLTDEKRAWIDELRLRLMVSKEKEASP